MNELDKIPKQNPFRVPDNYFEEVSEKIIAAASEAGTESRDIRKIVRIRNIIAIAASVAVLAILSIGILHINRNINRDLASIDINSEQVMETIISDIDVTALENEIEDLWFESGMAELESEEIIDYLLNENISPSEIYEIL